jgi:anti-sigma-K factor RskA
MPYCKTTKMKEKIRTFLDSDLLEKYLLGLTTLEESQQVERYIAMHPEVRENYLELQENLEAIPKMQDTSNYQSPGFGAEKIQEVCRCS